MRQGTVTCQPIRLRGGGDDDVSEEEEIKLEDSDSDAQELGNEELDSVNSHLDSFDHSLSVYIGQLKANKGILKLNFNRYIISEHLPNGRLKTRRPENNIFVRKLPCKNEDGNETSLFVCHKCDQNAQSLILNITPKSKIKESKLEI